MNGRDLSVLILVLVSFAFASCDDDGASGESQVELKTITLSRGEEEVSKQNNVFAWNMFGYIVNENGNTTVSPLSASFAMCMIANGANGATRDEIFQAFGFENCDSGDVIGFMQKLSNQLKPLDSKAVVSIANSLWHNESYNILDGFVAGLQTNYDAEVIPLNTANAAEEINKWCSDKTNGYINDLISSGSVTDNTAAVLVNALYFNGEWADKFDKSDTHKGFFYSADNEMSTVDFMSGEKDVVYTKTTNFTMASLDFGNGAYSARFILPNTGNTFDDCVNEIKTTGWDEIIKYGYITNVTVKIPKFTLQNHIDMKPIYERMGIKLAFNHDLADFSNISSTSGLAITNAYQSTYFKIDEDGATATTASNVVIGDLANLIPPFVLDRPFIFALTERSTGVILFIGKIEKL